MLPFGSLFKRYDCSSGCPRQGASYLKRCEHDDAQNRSGWIRDLQVNRAKCLIKESRTECGLESSWEDETLRSAPVPCCLQGPCYVVKESQFGFIKIIISYYLILKNIFLHDS